MSEFHLPSATIYDLKQGLNETEILTRYQLDSVAISDTRGNLLYSLEEEPIPSLLKAVFYGDKIIAAGVSEHDDTNYFGLSDDYFFRIKRVHDLS